MSIGVLAYMFLICWLDVREYHVPTVGPKCSSFILDPGTFHLLTPIWAQNECSLNVRLRRITRPISILMLLFASPGVYLRNMIQVRRVLVGSSLISFWPFRMFFVEHFSALRAGWHRYQNRYLGQKSASSDQPTFRVPFRNFCPGVVWCNFIIGEYGFLFGMFFICIMMCL